MARSKIVLWVIALIGLAAIGYYVATHHQPLIDEEGGGVATATPAPSQAQPESKPHATPVRPETSLALQWPVGGAFDPTGLRRSGPPSVRLATGEPDYRSSLGTLGSGSGERIAQWRQATAIVRVGDGWGSGAFISADGWLLTNYHVVAPAVQAAAVTGSAATVDVIRPRVVDGGLRPAPAVRGVVHRADAARDLALVKVDGASPGGAWFPLAASVSEGEDCYAIGSQSNGPAWWVRSGMVSQIFEYPEGLSQFAARAAGAASRFDRTRVRVVVTDTRFSTGDAGGPLINERGELIGIAMATLDNATQGSVALHVAIDEVRRFAASRPTDPAGIPFDVWTAGLTDATLFEPAFEDADDDGRPETLLYRYATVRGRQRPEPVALTAFVQLDDAPAAKDAARQLPAGLWGLGDRGRYRFDVSVTLRADGVVALGYTNAQGIVDQIRIGKVGDTGAGLVWTRDDSGRWAARQAGDLPLVDGDRLGNFNVRRLSRIVERITAGSGAPRPGR